MMDPINDNTVDMRSFADLMPEGAIPLHGIRIATFINAEGVEETLYDEDGQVPVQQKLAALEAVKMDLWFNATYGWVPDEEDEDDA